MMLRKSNRHSRVLVIGLDAAPPDLVFDRLREDLPNLSRLRNLGIWGRLESAIPPITVPAWTSMLSGQDAGQLGIYGFRNRTDYGYHHLAIADSSAVKVDRIWNILSPAGKEVALVGIPQTYPVAKVNGIMVSGLLTPSTESRFTYPDELRNEVKAVVGDYMIDVENFRTEDKDRLLRKIYEMTEKRFRLLRHLLRKKPWDFFMFVEIGPDRMHHGFWKYCDSEHRLYEPGNRFEPTMREYYQYLDREIGEILEMVDKNTVVMVVSDHGAKRMDGGICINEWLIRNGYLTLNEQPENPTPLSECRVDWSKTLAWAEGGYYGRLFLNVKGRELQGVINPEEYAVIRNELAEKIAAIPDDRGNKMATRVLIPEEVYHEVNGLPPDLMIYFGDLHWRSVGTVGTGEIYAIENDTGPDNANHSEYGIFILYDPQNPGGGQEVPGAKIVDVAPTLLQCFGLKPPENMTGKSLFRRL